MTQAPVILIIHTVTHIHTHCGQQFTLESVLIYITCSLPYPMTQVAMSAFPETNSWNIHKLTSTHTHIVLLLVLVHLSTGKSVHSATQSLIELTHRVSNLRKNLLSLIEITFRNGISKYLFLHKSTSHRTLNTLHTGISTCVSSNANKLTLFF